MASGNVLDLLTEDSRPAVQAGGEILRIQREPFPDRRPCRDVLFAALFLVVATGLGVVAWMETRGFTFKGTDFGQHDDKKMPVQSVCVAIAVSCVASFVLSLLFVWLTRAMTKIVVWAALLLTPVIYVAAAVSIFFFLPDRQRALLLAGVLAACAVLQLLCVLFCWAKYIPLTIEILEPVAGVLSKKFNLAFVALGGLVTSVVWTFLCAAATIGVYDRMSKAQRKCDDENMETCSLGKFYAFYFVFLVGLYWGATIVQNVCHVTNCGIFGRWYFGRRESVCSSFTAAVTTSFGSICLGSLIVAVVQAVEMSLRNARRNSDNVVSTIILCALECVVACIRGIIEAFSYFAYVQVAIRGLGFISSAKATFALCKYRNVYLIVSCCLVGNVVFLGSLLCGIGAGLIGAVVGMQFHPDGADEDSLAATDTVNVIFGFLMGVIVSTMILNVLRSGFATIVVCWAEQGECLRAHQPDLYASFQQRAAIAADG